MMWQVFAAGALVQVAFMAWYFNWRGPMRPAEIEKVMDAFEGSSASETTDPDDLRAFLEADDGRQFFMVNYLDLRGRGASGRQADGADKAAGTLNRYTRPFVRALMKRGGHPVYVLKRVGGKIDTWNCDHDIDFQIMAMMRYRSRRDLAALISSASVPEVHQFKLKALDRTLSFPTQFKMSAFLTPASWVPLLILLACSFVQIFLM